MFIKFIKCRKLTMQDCCSNERYSQAFVEIFREGLTPNKVTIALLVIIVVFTLKRLLYWRDVFWTTVSHLALLEYTLHFHQFSRFIFIILLLWRCFAPTTVCLLFYIYRLLLYLPRIYRKLVSSVKFGRRRETVDKYLWIGGVCFSYFFAKS